MSTRVVVTGLGALTPLGKTVAESWAALLAGKSGIRPIGELANAESYERHCPPSLAVADVKEFDPHAYGNLFTSQDLRRMSQFTQFAVVAAQEALRDANLIETLQKGRNDRVGCVIGSGIASVHDMYDSIVEFDRGKRLSPSFVPKILSNMACGNVSIKFQLRGVSHCVSTACATGNNAIGDAYNFIRLGYNDVCLAGASEASVHPLALAGFLRAKSITPSGISRPFDKERNGFVLGEGAGLLVLESLKHAQDRGARIYAEVEGYGLTSDAHHITSPSENGDGARRAMEMALNNQTRSQVDYVNAHATSTVLGDRAEAQAISNILSGDGKDAIKVSSNKGAIGHLLGAAGAVESIFTIKSLQDGVVPHTLNLHSVGGASGDEAENFERLDLVRGAPAKHDIRRALNNSFGFGGINSSIVFRRWEV
ncbi:fatty acid synthase CEM1 [Lachancea thermotolerans CBS 6340]|uniref:3-oxoacyl-[acyl-carrier-protein] synthase n=1 Tax=Lachancea thermotolerans (strain ATCC 56472 / CBS 6340 / NRRL Y-8284) TaxID=559295 RepID=C5DBP6_LACTC|nr:KLTH0A04334p [Lachancea thermotolerans CBS 6340]CAR21203.1 KLTH0A04334p [Lachancea thermotolerans CBS 6340]